MTHLEKLHNKPSHEKRRHAMQISAVLTGLVFLGWLTTLGPRIVAQLSPSDDTTTDSRSAGKDVFGMIASVGAALSGQPAPAKSGLSAAQGDAASSTVDASAVPAPTPASAAPASVIVLPSAIPTDDSTTTTAIPMPDDSVTQ